MWALEIRGATHSNFEKTALQIAPSSFAAKDLKYFTTLSVITLPLKHKPAAFSAAVAMALLWVAVFLKTPSPPTFCANFQKLSAPVAAQSNGE